MKIAIDARIIRSGTGRYIERLLHYLEKLDTEHEYLILLRKNDLDYYKPTNPNFTVVEADFADYSFGEQLGLARLLHQLKPDLVHFCMPQQPLFYFGAAVTTVHDLNLLRITANDDMGWLELRLKKIIFRGLLWWVSRKSTHIFAPSNYTRDDLLKFSRIDPHRVSVTYEGVDIASASPQPIAKLQKSEFIMYVGRAEPYKNNRRLIEAHQQLLEHLPHLRLVIVGNKDILRQSDIEWAKQNKYKNIDFLGFVSDQQLAWLYTHCRAYVFPSWMEGFGLPGLEAMAYGAPVVSSNATCLPEVYKDAAIYFNPHSTADMAAAIERVISNEGLGKELIAKGRKVCIGYSWQRMAMQTQNEYNLQLKQK